VGKREIRMSKSAGFVRASRAKLSKPAVIRQKSGQTGQIVTWLFAAALVAAVFLAYQPAWQGGQLWDDDAHITRPELRSWHGLYRIWFDVGATLQYYPLVHSVFWVEHRLWGDATLGYHLVNLVLHCCGALMVAAILRQLAIPGAWLAAAIFALHPVQVESVAWITELKNTLSGVLYLGAAMLYFRFDQTRKTAWYFSALGLFVLALLTKTVTGTLPGALLVIFWWQRGRLSLTKDVLPLAPFFVLGAGMGMLTAWWELKLNHCDGPEFQFTSIERILIAGRGVWFHLGKLFWPAQLTFMYPRWQIDSGDWRQYLYPLGGAALLAVAWAMRRPNCIVKQGTRAPLAALLFFGGTLFPVMGFFNLYTYRYSFIADHYQYLACLGIITLFSAGAVRIAHRVTTAACYALVAILAFLTWQQSFMYANAETLYRTTIARNPDCWMAFANLGKTLEEQGKFADAIDQYQQALQIQPDDAETHYCLANALADLGRDDDAIAQYHETLRLRSNLVAAYAYCNLGIALARQGRFGEAINQYKKSLDIDPNFVAAHFHLGVSLARLGQLDEAIEHFQRALAINPDYLDAHVSLAVLFAHSGRVDRALDHYRSALNLASARHDRAQVESIRAQIRQIQK
jgi:protein O-mannosyl-transferase